MKFSEQLLLRTPADDCFFEFLITYLLQKQPSRGVLRKRCSEIMQQESTGEFTGEHPCQSAISVKLLLYGCFPVNLLYIFGTPFPKNASRGFFLDERLNKF